MTKYIFLMKAICLMVVLHLSGFHLRAQTNEFTWIAGSSDHSKLAVFGPKGSPGPTYTPGSREGAVSWADNAGNIWLFGGEPYGTSGNFDVMNDLWKFNTSTKQWAYVSGSTSPNQTEVYGIKGIPSSTNTPGARQYASAWTDASGNLWLFGGYRKISSPTWYAFNDMWKYDVTTNQWTWMNGSNETYQSSTFGTIGVPAPNNTPGGRSGCINWKDDTGNFWLCAGSGYNFTNSSLMGLLNQLWKFDPVTNQWTFIKGNNLLNQGPVYGTQNVGAPANRPGARNYGSGWSDKNGNVWIFGGTGYRNATTADALNDMWKYEIATGNWIWISGDDFYTVYPVYGGEGVPSTSYDPGSRAGQAYWQDTLGNFWLFGGVGRTAAKNDLWKYNPLADTWAYMKGTQSENSPGGYGTLGGPSYYPGARSLAAYCVDDKGDFWLYGGYGYASQYPGMLADLWKYSPPGDPSPAITSFTPASVCGSSTTITINGNNLASATLRIGSTNITSITSNTNTQIVATIHTPVSGLIKVTTANGIVYSTSSFSLNALPAITAEASSPVSCQGIPVALTAQGANTYTWTPGSLSGNAVNVSPASSTNYTVTGTNTVTGCSNSTTVAVQINYPTTSTLTTTVCPPFILNGQTYTGSGTYTQIRPNAAGCDSTITLNLTVKQPTSTSITQSACGSYILNGQTYTTSGTYTQTRPNAAGCDSTITLYLTVKQPTSSSITQSACGSYVLNGQTYTTSGTYTQTRPNAAGCDSTITLYLTVKQPTSSSISQSACGSYVLNGQTYTTSGTYTQTRPNAAGCDSTITLYLTVKQPTSSSITQSACGSYVLNGQTYTTSGTHTQTRPNAAGCDSTITLYLTVKQPTSSSITQSACGSYILNGQTYTTSGIYTQTLTNAAGCDSILTLNLTIKQPTTSVITQNSCGNYTLNGQTYNSSGTYTQTLTNAAGCDSMLTLHLTVKQPTFSSITQSACGSYTLNGQIYTASGIYTQTLTNAAGCDSTLMLNLTVKQPTTSVITQNSCGNYTLNGQTYNSSGTYTQTLTNTAGCDSTLTLHLTLEQSTASSITQFNCGSYTLNGETYTTSGIYMQTLTNAAGCDSMLTLHLTIDTVNVTVILNGTTLTAGAGNAAYQWIDCKDNSVISGATAASFSATENGSYSVMVTQNGCSDTSSCLDINTLGITENSSATTWTLYPNPTQGYITISGLGPNSWVSVLNSLGQTLWQQQAPSHQTEVDLSAYASGVYFIQITVNHVTSTKKVIRN